MRPLLRTYLAIAFALMMVLTSHSMAATRGMSTAMGEITLCTGTGPISVLVDENGTPIGAPHICPDCTLLLFASFAEDPAPLLRPAKQGLAMRIDLGGWVDPAAAVRAVARCPPLLV